MSVHMMAPGIRAVVEAGEFLRYLDAVALVVGSKGDDPELKQVRLFVTRKSLVMAGQSVTRFAAADVSLEDDAAGVGIASISVDQVRAVTALFKPVMPSPSTADEKGRFLLSLESRPEGLSIHDLTGTYTEDSITLPTKAVADGPRSSQELAMAVLAGVNRIVKADVQPIHGGVTVDHRDLAVLARAVGKFGGAVALMPLGRMLVSAEESFVAGVFLTELEGDPRTVDEKARSAWSSLSGSIVEGDFS